MSDKWPKWEPQTSKTSDIGGLTAKDLRDTIDLMAKRGQEEYAKAHEYAKSWPKGYRGIGADIYLGRGPTIANLVLSCMDDPEFRKALLRAAVVAGQQ